MSMHTGPTPEEQNRLSHRINLGQQGLSVGLRLPPEVQQRLRPSQEAKPQADAPMSVASAYGRSAGASMTPTVESGSIAEALAAMLEGGLHGRAAYGQQMREESEQGRERKREDAQRNSYAEALQRSQDPTLTGAARTNGIAEALAGADPQAAFAYSQSQELTPQQRQVEAMISQLPPDQQALARMDPEGYVRGMMRHRFPAPSTARSGSGVDSTPPVPDGFVLD